MVLLRNNKFLDSGHHVIFPDNEQSLIFNDMRASYIFSSYSQKENE